MLVQPALIPEFHLRKSVMEMRSSSTMLWHVVVLVTSLKRLQMVVMPGWIGSGVSIALFSPVSTEMETDKAWGGITHLPPSAVVVVGAVVVAMPC
jgi:hypothetical protein